MCEPIAETGDLRGPGMEESTMNGELLRKFRETLLVKPADLARGLGITIPELLKIESDEIKINQWQYAQMSMLIVDFFLVAWRKRTKEREAAKKMGNGNHVKSDG